MPEKMGKKRLIFTFLHFLADLGMKSRDFRKIKNVPEELGENLGNFTCMAKVTGVS